jgi:hypothetical protein
MHALGDYVDTIKMHGTTDSYSTEPVREIFVIWVPSKPTQLYTLQDELEHRHPKARYKCTSKKRFKQQLAQIE